MRACLTSALHTPNAALDVEALTSQGLLGACASGGIEMELLASAQSKLEEVLTARANAVAALQAARAPTMAEQDAAALEAALGRAQEAGVGQAAYEINGEPGLKLVRDAYAWLSQCARAAADRKAAAHAPLLLDLATVLEQLGRVEEKARTDEREELVQCIAGRREKLERLKRTTGRDVFDEIELLLGQTHSEFGDDFAKLRPPSTAAEAAEAADEAGRGEKSAEGGLRGARASLSEAIDSAVSRVVRGREAVVGIECVSTAAEAQIAGGGGGARAAAASDKSRAEAPTPLPLLSDAEKGKRLALAPPAVLLMREGAIEGDWGRLGERLPYEGLYTLEQGSYVNQRPLFRLVEPPEPSVPRCLAWVSEGKDSWAGQLDEQLGSAVAYLQLVDATVPSTPDRCAAAWQGVCWRDALAVEGQWTARPTLRCTALVEEQVRLWQGIEVEGQLMATGIAIAVTGHVDEEEYTEYVLHSIMQADDGAITEHRAKHRFSNFVALHTALQPSLAPLMPAKFPLGRLQVAVTAAAKAVAKQRRGQQLQVYLRQLAAAVALKGIRRGGPRLYAFIDVNAWLHMGEGSLDPPEASTPLLSAAALGEEPSAEERAAIDPAAVAVAADAPLLTALDAHDDASASAPPPPPPETKQWPDAREWRPSSLRGSKERRSSELDLGPDLGPGEARDRDRGRDRDRSSALSAEGPDEGEAGGATPLLDLDLDLGAAEDGAPTDAHGGVHSGVHDSAKGGANEGNLEVGVKPSPPPPPPAAAGADPAAAAEEKPGWFSRARARWGKDAMPVASAALPAKPPPAAAATTPAQPTMDERAAPLDAAELPAGPPQ